MGKGINYLRDCYLQGVLIWLCINYYFWFPSRIRRTHHQLYLWKLQVGHHSQSWCLLQQPHQIRSLPRASPQTRLWLCRHWTLCNQESKTSSK
jgi:hypothetical protein